MSKRTPTTKRAPKGARQRRRPKSLAAGRAGPHPRFGKATLEQESRERDLRAKPKTSTRRKAARAQPVVSVLGRRLTPPPKPRT